MVLCHAAPESGRLVLVLIRRSTRLTTKVMTTNLRGTSSECLAALIALNDFRRPSSNIVKLVDTGCATLGATALCCLASDAFYSCIDVSLVSEKSLAAHNAAQGHKFKIFEPIKFSIGDEYFHV
jgi:hypothetical protein